MRIPPRQPKRSVKSLFAPRDVTETARQGQGIGDIEAMKQMAKTVIPEVMRNAPATSAPMAGYDMLNEARQGNYGAAGLAALGLIPFGGMIEDVGRNAPKVFGSAMEEALQKLKMFGADLSEDATILNRRAGVKDIPAPTPQMVDQPIPPPNIQGKLFGQRTDVWSARVAADAEEARRRQGMLREAFNQADQPVVRAKNALDEAKAWRKAVGNDPNASVEEWAQANEEVNRLRDQWKALLNERGQSVSSANRRIYPPK